MAENHNCLSGCFVHTNAHWLYYKYRWIAVCVTDFNRIGVFIAAGTATTIADHKFNEATNATNADKFKWNPHDVVS